jgi:hypothetical protein
MKTRGTIVWQVIVQTKGNILVVADTSDEALAIALAFYQGETQQKHVTLNPMYNARVREDA